MSSPRSLEQHYNSATHAGGIQPPASFFRPSKPFQPQYSRPSSPSSSIDQHPLPDDNHHNVVSSISDPDSDLPLKRIKQSREPLLPISRSGHPPPPSNSKLDRNLSASNPTRSATRLVRNSFDRVLSIGHGMSFDSIRRSTTTRTPPIEGRPTFESKLSDDELEDSAAYGYPPTPQNYDHSPIQHHNFTGGQSLSVRASRNSALLSVTSPSPELSFIPKSPDRFPPLSAVPLINPKTGKYVRRYELHPSRNRFFLGGRLLTGGDSPWAFMASFSLVLIIAGVWFGTTAVWWWKNKSPAVAIIGAYLALLTISTMLTTACSHILLKFFLFNYNPIKATIDPGILPRNLDPDPPYPSTSPSDGGLRAPMPRDLKVRTDV